MLVGEQHQRNSPKNMAVQDFGRPLDIAAENESTNKRHKEGPDGNDNDGIGLDFATEHVMLWISRTSR